MHSIEYQVFFGSSVQGVGFRQTVYSVALKHHLKGYVKNLQDGRVELRILADEHTLKSMIEEIKVKARHAHITTVEIQKLSVLSQFDNFTIKRD